jgi:hypothetical protein
MFYKDIFSMPKGPESNFNTTILMNTAISK